ncbi:uncharacterized protein LOC131697937 [Acipenser ruthenus]|uniref:uncharacterized protein LOC131697937 n=1 Tax=Acipenser ruthenus TaxID=7906 RepID=UPI00274289A1|nr:uncharacterized protein LOC131697937 [Acipenser ruthenus]
MMGRRKRLIPLEEAIYHASSQTDKKKKKPGVQIHQFRQSVDTAQEDLSLGRLVNDDHKKPNCKMKNINVEGKPHLCLFVLRNITCGEEITYNYGPVNWPWRIMVTDEAESPVNNSVNEPVQLEFSGCSSEVDHAPDAIQQSTSTATQVVDEAESPVNNSEPVQPEFSGCSSEVDHAPDAIHQSTSTATQLSDESLDVLSDYSQFDSDSDQDYVPDSSTSDSTIKSKELMTEPKKKKACAKQNAPTSETAKH